MNILINGTNELELISLDCYTYTGTVQHTTLITQLSSNRLTECELNPRVSSGLTSNCVD